MTDEEKEKLRMLGILGGLILGGTILLGSMLSLSVQMARGQKEYARARLEKTEMAPVKRSSGCAHLGLGIVALGVAAACTHER